MKIRNRPMLILISYFSILVPRVQKATEKHWVKVSISMDTPLSKLKTGSDNLREDGLVGYRRYRRGFLLSSEILQCVSVRCSTFAGAFSCIFGDELCCQVKTLFPHTNFPPKTLFEDGFPSEDELSREDAFGRRFARKMSVPKI